MRVKLSENIKRFRKERKMTQEQLAEAMGVSISAVYKWESNQSTPEINLILGLADLFQTSTDVLLGYEWSDRSCKVYLEKLAVLKKENRHDEAAAEAEKALKNYPNHFDVVYQSAMLYLEFGESAKQKKEIGRAIELLEHACELIAQNQDDAVSEVSIRTQIAKANLLLHKPETALQILKEYNICGINNALIGMVLGDYLHNADEAEKYLGKAFSAFAENINSIMIGYANVFFQRKNYDAVIDCFLWLRTVLRGIQPQTELTWFDKYDCVILETIAECFCCKGEVKKARDFLREALTKALRYDSAEEVSDMQFFTMLHIEKQPTYDAYGKTAVECLERRLQPEDDGVPQLWQLWLDVKQEVLG